MPAISNQLTIDALAGYPQDGPPTPEPADGRNRYFDRKMWDRSGQAGDNLGIQEEEDDDDDGDYDQDGGSRALGEKSSSDDVGPDDVGERDEDDGSDEDDEVEGLSRMPEKESAARIDNVSSKLQVNMIIQTQRLKNAHRTVRQGPRGNLTAGGCALRILNRGRSRQAQRLMPSFRGHAPSLPCHLMPRCADPFRRPSTGTPGCRNC